MLTRLNRTAQRHNPFRGAKSNLYYCLSPQWLAVAMSGNIHSEICAAAGIVSSGLSLGFGSRQVLRDIKLTVAPGGICACSDRPRGEPEC